MVVYFLVTDILIYWEILCRPDPNGGSEISSIHYDPALSTFDQPLSTFSGLSPALILVRAGLWIFEYTGLNQIFG